MHVIEGDNAEYLFLRLLSKVKHGNLVCPRNIQTLELDRPICLTLNDINKNLITNPYRKLNYAFAIAETLWIWSGSDRLDYLTPYNKQMARFSDDGTTLSGSYGPPFRSQLDYLCDTLKSDRDSRQAVITIWNPNPQRSKDIPCTVMMHFMVRDFKLNLNVYMRSNDAWLGFPYDITTFTTLQKQLAAILGFRCGIYNHIVGSMHLYMSNLPDVEWAIKYPGNAERLPGIKEPDTLDRLVEVQSYCTTKEYGGGVFTDKFVQLHGDLLHAYWNKKRGNVYEFPEPYKSLRHEAQVCHRGVGGSTGSNQPGEDDTDSRHGG